MIPLTQETLAQGVTLLAQSDPDLARVVERFGPPPLWEREPGFPTLLTIILEQQVSLASARAAYDRLVERIGPPTPDEFLTLDDAELRRIGFSRQKARYCRELAQALIEGFDLRALETLEEGKVRERLIALPGIGRWTADIYLLMALLRPDIWPAGDRALAVAAQEVKGLPACPTPVELEEIGSAWRPWRAVAARILWHHYLSRRRTVT